jgi:hypothetical protein
MSNAKHVIQCIESGLSVDGIRAMSLEDIERIEETLYHWQGVISSVLREIIKARREEETE